MELEQYLQRGKELAQSINLEELSDTAMEQLEDLALEMATEAWDKDFFAGPRAQADKLWKAVFKKHLYELSFSVDVPGDDFWELSGELCEYNGELLFAGIAEEDAYADEEVEPHPEYTALKLTLTAHDPRPEHQGDQFILANIYVCVALPLSTFEEQEPSDYASIEFFPELHY